MRPRWAITRADPVAAASSVTGWLGLAALAGAWAAYFLRTEPLWAMLAVPLVGAGIAGLARRPLPSAALVAGAGIVTWASGVSWGNVDMVLPFAIALFAAGRRLTWRAGVVLAGVCIVSSALRDAPSLDTFAVATWLFGSMWAFGRLVDRRAAQARAALDQARHLSDADPVVLAARRAREERARLANQSLVAVRDAVVEMRASAQRARDGLDDGHLDHIRERGAAAVDELRHLLGLLRTGADPTHPERPPAPGPGRSGPGRSGSGRSGSGRSGSAPFRALRLLAPVAVIAVLLIAHPHWDRSVALSALYLGGLAALALGARTPTGAALLVTAATLLALLDPPRDPESLLPMAVVYAAFAWHSAEVAPARLPLVVGLPGTTAAVVAARYGDTAVAFIAIVFLLPLLAGRAWGERDRILRGAEQRSEHLQAALDEAVTSAVRRERLRLARDLHDVTGHAIGVMVLHAGAASATRDRDRAQAREHVETIIDASSTALAEIDELFDVLDSVRNEDRPTVASRLHRAPHELRAAVTQMARTARQSGRHVHLVLGDLPTEPTVVTTTYRVVQEAITNALRHSVGGLVRIEIDRRPCGSPDAGHRVRITDTGRALRDHAGDGYGLAGLRERVQLCGGQVRAGRDLDAADQDGFVVEAILPPRCA